MIDIDPNFIESIDLIKSMAGRAKYGIVGGNGIISIKTKRGYKSKPRIIFKTSIGIDQISQRPDLQNTYAQGRTFAGVGIYNGPETFQQLSWGPKISDLTYDGATDYPYDPNGRLQLGGSGQAANVYDNVGNFFQTGTNATNSLSVDGGNEVATFRASF